MRAASEVLEDLLILIERTELGNRIAEQGRERWAIDCARRALSANIDRCGEQLPALRQGLATAKRWLAQPPDDDQRNHASAAAWAARDGIQRRAQAASRHRIALLRTVKTAETIAHALDCVAGLIQADRVAAVAREAFPDQQDEAGAQARRLLFWTRLLPSGAELLVRLDYAESRGRLPIDGEQRAWIEGQRVLLMADDEAGRLALVLRHLELVFLAEFERIR